MTTRPELSGTFGMVASTHWLATGAGMSVLERGGNAIDAACAAGFVLQVVEPHLNGPGGDLPAIVYSVADARAQVVCGQGVAPAAATIERFADLGLNQVPGTGLLAATVPGAFAAWTAMLEQWGSWELSDVLGYALEIAEAGFPVLERIAAVVDAVAGFFTEHWPSSAQVWLPDGRAPQSGGIWRSPALAQTYRQLLAAASGPTREARIEAARRHFYEGFVAEQIDRFCAQAWRDSSGHAHAGLLSGQDLAGWRPTVEEPVRVPYAGRYEVLKTPPWGQGPVLLQQLRLLEALQIADVPMRSGQWAHLIVEAAKLAFADREAWYGDDPAVPLDTLLSPAYAQSRARLVTDTADLQLRPGSPDGRTPRLAQLSAQVPATDSAQLPGARSTGTGLGEPTVRPSELGAGDTCHVDVVDRWGNMVSATPSGGWLQSSPVITGLGFPLGTRAQMFYLQPGLPNSLAPGKRPRTTLSPSLALRDGQAWLAFGTPGGDQQDQWQLPFFLDIVHGRSGLQAAIDAPTLHTTHFPSSFYPREAYPGEVHVEDRFAAEALADLRARGHRVVLPGPWSLGRISAVERDGSILRAGANARGAQGYAAGR